MSSSILCKNCGEEVSNKRNTFCSQSCAASYNNKGVRRHVGISKSVCPKCGGKKAPQSKQCQECRNQEAINKALDLPLSHYKDARKSVESFGKVRRWARKLMKLRKVTPKCVVCGYDNPQVLEVDHIIPICTFPETALLKEVNDKDNLRYVCPTHHKEFELGII